jgi:FkbH-like protein
MTAINTDQASTAGRPARRVVVAATFTAEPLKESIDFWMRELELPAAVEFAPYDQVFQQLLDPGSMLSQNKNGVNVALIRFDDWTRPRSGSRGPRVREQTLDRNADDLIKAARAAAARSTAPLLVGFCPDAPLTEFNPIVQAVFTRIESELGAVPGLYLLRPSDYRLYAVDDYYDPRRDQLGHIPFTPAFFTALGTIVARKIHSLFYPPYKVIVLDCDNTVWKGVVGEEGVAGIALPPAYLALQRFMVDLAGKGFVLCLCSKNDEPDVLEVFDRRSDMVLKRDHLVSWRINWQPKSHNIRSLAQELNLGLDSFIFVDDNPVECAEVRGACPEVLTLRLPIEGDIEEFLDHVWAFDRLRVTALDQHRTEMYKQEADRARFQKEAPTISDFLAGLDLKVTITQPIPDQIERVAQLTQRTNQFNFTTVRRNQGEIARLPDSNLECRVVEVSDRFGDYGLVGVAIFGAKGDALEIDTLLLSCRVLGRGVEHRMLNELGEIARRRQLTRVVATLIPTRKNQPARDFLMGSAGEYGRQVEGLWRFEVPADVAAAIAYSPADALADAPKTADDPPHATTPYETAGQPRTSERFERIALLLSRPEKVLDAARAYSAGRSARPELGRRLVAPRNAGESELARIWADLLRLDMVGIRDNFFDLGGTSLLAVDLFAQIEKGLGKTLPLTAIIEAPTIEQLAPLVAGDADRDSLVLIRDGGDLPALFLVHDGDGETMLYRNLALRLNDEHAVYGLQPHALPNVPMAHTRIGEMAAHHIRKMRSIQPRGPYLVGGMCAGGVIAFEIALQLQRQAENVALVAVIDAADAAATRKNWRMAGQRLRRLSSVISQDQRARFDRRILTVLKKVLSKARNLTTYLVGQRLKEWRDDMRMRRFRSCLDRDRDLPHSLEHIPVRTVYLFAEENYMPAGLFDGNLALFRATHGEGNDEPYIERYEDPLLGWGRRAIREVVVHDVPGGHSSMLQEPNVQVLAEQLQMAIDSALADVADSAHELASSDTRKQSPQRVPTIR